MHQFQSAHIRIMAWSVTLSLSLSGCGREPGFDLAAAERTQPDGDSPIVENGESQPRVDQASHDTPANIHASALSSPALETIDQSSSSDPRVSTDEPPPLTPAMGFAARGKKRFIKPDLTGAEKAAFRRSLSKRLSHDSTKLPRIALGNGNVAIETQDHFQHVVVQVRDEHGNFRTECLEHSAHLDAILNAKGTP